MNALKPATATTASAGIRRMEAELPLPLGEERAVGARGHLAEVRHWSSSAAKNPHAVGDAQIAGKVFYRSLGLKTKRCLGFHNTDFEMMKKIFFSAIVMLMAYMAVISCSDKDSVAYTQEECGVVSGEEITATLASDIEFYKNNPVISASISPIRSTNKRAIEDGYMRLQTCRAQLTSRAALEEQMSLAFEDMVPLPRPQNMDGQVIEDVVAFLLKSFADDMVDPQIALEQLARAYEAAIGDNVHLQESKAYFSQVVTTFSDVIVSAGTMGLASAEREFESCMRRKLNGMNKFEMAVFVIGISESFVVLSGACLCETITDSCK
ncbi:MAG: hypothetical protein IJU72_07790 [Bacteroidales bacterium]|nr:hypothetical protein [Bacteroidales bacterium]